MLDCPTFKSAKYCCCLCSLTSVVCTCYVYLLLFAFIIWSALQGRDCLPLWELPSAVESWLHLGPWDSPVLQAENRRKQHNLRKCVYVKWACGVIRSCWRPTSLICTVHFRGAQSRSRCTFSEMKLRAWCVLQG